MRRKELLDAAERAIRRIGPNASMDELAAEAGITKPILYSHFGDRAGLAEAMADRTANQLIVTVTDALETAVATGSAEAVTRATVLSFCNFIEAEPSIYRFLVRATLSTGTPMSSRLATGISQRISALLSITLGQIGRDNSVAEPWAFGMVGLAFAGGEWWLESSAMTKEELVDCLTSLLWGGLAGAGLDQLTEKDTTALVALAKMAQAALIPQTS